MSQHSSTSGRFSLDSLKWLRLLLGSVVCCIFLAGCNDAELEEFAVTVEIEDESVRFNWDGRAVHVFTVYRPGTAADWHVTFSEEDISPPPGEPTIVPPLYYGQQVEAAFTHNDPAPLLHGHEYTVQAFVRGWGAECEYEESDPNAQCYIAMGRTQFTF